MADGVPLSPNASNYKPAILSDGSSGSIIAWYGGSGSDVFAQRLLASGSVAAGWPVAAPLTVCAAAGLQESPVLVSDMAGGAILFWQDARNGSNYDIMAQRITSGGQIPSTSTSNWVDDGNPVSTAAGNQYTPIAISDEAGGAIVVWQDGRLGAGNYDIYAQRVDADGNLLWAPAGVPVCAAQNNQINPTVLGDGAGGAFVAWQDYRRGNEYDIYVQHLNADGAMVSGGLWIANGLGVCVAPKSQFYPVLTGDGSGGVYVAWQDYRTGTDNHIYAHHLSAGGAAITGWPADGAPVCQAQFSQYYPTVAGDGAGGLFVAWQDYRSGTTNHIFAQHVTALNTVVTADGFPVSLALNGQFSPQMAYDGANGAFVAWYDSRSGQTNDIYVHRISRLGQLNPTWDADGFPVCLAPNTQQFPVVTMNQPGSAIVTWQDLRSGGLTTAAIFAQQALSATGTTDVGETDVAHAALSSARPNPSRGATRFQMTLPRAAFVRAEVLDLSGRRVALLAAQPYPAGVHSLTWNGNTFGGEQAAPGVYLVRVLWPGFDRTERIVRLR
jgi:hypothetical protein